MTKRNPPSRKRTVAPLTAAQLATATGGGLLSIPLGSFTEVTGLDAKAGYRGSWVE